MSDMLASSTLIAAQGWRHRVTGVVVHLQAERYERVDETRIIVSIVSPDETVIPGLHTREKFGNKEAARQAWAREARRLKVAGFERVG